MRIELISTTDMRGGRADELERMLKSVARAQAALPEERITLHLLLQNCDEEARQRMDVETETLPFACIIESVERQIPLTVARNIMLRRLLSEAPPDDRTLVAYPDDDCWYPTGFLEMVVEKFKQDTELDFWFCCYGSMPKEVAETAIETVVAPRFSQVVRNASSNTMFFRGGLASRIGLFDEKLGVGTPNGSAEDLDYALRGYFAARRSAFINSILVGHRDKLQQFRTRYYHGSLLVLARYARVGAGGEWRRKLAVGLYLLFRQELSVKNYVRAIRSSMSEFGSFHA
jgi:hypothetical protein